MYDLENHQNPFVYSHVKPHKLLKMKQQHLLLTRAFDTKKKKKKKLKKKKKNLHASVHKHGLRFWFGVFVPRHKHGARSIGVVRPQQHFDGGCFRTRYPSPWALAALRAPGRARRGSQHRGPRRCAAPQRKDRNRRCGLAFVASRPSSVVWRVGLPCFRYIAGVPPHSLLWPPKMHLPLPRAPVPVEVSRGTQSHA